MRLWLGFGLLLSAELSAVSAAHLHLKLLRLGLARSKDVLLQEEQQNLLPIIAEEEQRMYSWWAVHPKSDPSSLPVSLRMSSQSPSLPVLLGLERFALQ
ncbi:hypothetical protein TURU_147232 [Turdus rufiventris]|nr:hypothetical protein TURU_147232 [Turdus rufiventris]